MPLPNLRRTMTTLLLALGLAMNGPGPIPTAGAGKVPAAVTPTRYCINRAGTAVYGQPSLRAAVRQYLPVGRAIGVLEVRPSADTRLIGKSLVLPGDWLRIELNGTPGYVFSSDVTAHRPQVLRSSDGRPYVVLLGAKQSSYSKKHQVRVANHNETITDDITQYAHCTYTYTAFDGCFDHSYRFSGLSLAEVYHHLANGYSGYQNGKLVLPKVLTHQGRTFSFTPGLGDADATQEIKLIIHPDNRIELQTADCT